MNQRILLINEILSISSENEILNIHNRVGITGYIDFININEVNSPVMQGVDCMGRPFITVCAEIKYADGTIIPTFTTFFKRYSDNSSTTWHACGFYHKLMETSGGMSIPQFIFLRDLLRNGNVVFDDGTDDDNIKDLRLVNYGIFDNDEIMTRYMYQRPVSVSLAMSNSTSYNRQ
jgi:hypothetical protein